MSACPVLAALFVSLLSVTGAAQETPPPIDPELRARFGFLGPEIVKIGNGIDLLRLADIDGDGKDEVVVSYAQRGRLEVIARTDDDPEVRHVDPGGVLRGLAVADADGEGDPEFLVLTDRGRLTVRPVAGGRALAQVEVGPPASTDALRAGDLDGDGAADAVAWTRDGIVAVLDPVRDPKLLPPIAIGEDRPRSFELFDADGDGRLDVVLGTPSHRFGLRLARGTGDGFGPWLLFEVPNLTAVFPGAGVNGNPTLAVLQDSRRRVVEYRIARRDDESRSTAAVEWTSLPVLKRGAFPFVHGDVDGDGSADLVLAHPERAELVYLLERGGRFEQRTAPTLAGVHGMALGDVDGDGRDDLVLASGEEQALAWRSGTAPLDEFPSRLPSAEEPLAVAVHPEGGVLYVGKDRRRQGSLYRVRRTADGFAEPEKVASLGRLGGDPQRLLLAELDDVPGPEAALVVPGDGLVIVQSTAEGGYEDADAKTAAGFTRRIEDGALMVIETEAQGAALVVVRERFARLFRLDAEGRPEILTQVNGPAGSEELTFGTVQPGGVSLFLDTEVGKLYQVPAEGAARSVDVPPIGATHLLRHGQDTLILGMTGVLRVRFGPAWELVEVRAHEPPTVDTDWFAGTAADLDGQEGRELALLDEDIHGVHVLVAEPERLRRALSFPSFELPEASEVYEPRAISSGDFDGDGRQDLVLIAYDRVLIYLQEE